MICLQRRLTPDECRQITSLRELAVLLESVTRFDDSWNARQERAIEFFTRGVINESEFFALSRTI